jgi:hypothetical protein
MEVPLPCDTFPLRSTRINPRPGVEVRAEGEEEGEGVRGGSEGPHLLQPFLNP